MTDPVKQGNTLTYEDELRFSLVELRDELKQLSEELDIEEDFDKRNALQTQIDGKRDVLLMLECDLSMAGETA